MGDVERLLTISELSEMIAPSGGPLFRSWGQNVLQPEGFVNFHLGYAAAVACMLVLLAGTVVAINFFASRYWVRYDN